MRDAEELVEAMGDPACSPGQGDTTLGALGPIDPRRRVSTTVSRSTVRPCCRSCWPRECRRSLRPIRGTAGLRARAYFAEGLASSFEAYRDTRERQQLRESLDDAGAEESRELPLHAAWYLGHLDRALPKGGSVARAHPKIAATAQTGARAVVCGREGCRLLLLRRDRAGACELTSRTRSRSTSFARRPEAQDRSHGYGSDRGGGRAAETALLRSRRAGDEGGERRRSRASSRASVSATRSEHKRSTSCSVSLRTPSFLVRYINLADRNRVRAFAEAL